MSLTIALLGFLALSLPLALIDLRERRLPDRLVLPAYPSLVLLLLAAAIEEGAWPRLLDALVCSGALFGGYLALRLMNPTGLGGGDVKLAAPIGLLLGWFGWPSLWVATAVTFIAAAGFGAGLLLTQKVLARPTLSKTIAFGPFMLGGAWAVVLPALVFRLS